MREEMNRLAGEAARQGFSVVCVRKVWEFTYAHRVTLFRDPRTEEELFMATARLERAGLILPPPAD